MRDAFKWADADNSGTISFDELVHALDLLGVPMTEEKLSLLWASCDTNANGEISYAEFVSAFARDTSEITLAPTVADPQPTPLEQKRAKVLQTVEDKLDGRYVNLRKARLHPNPPGARATHPPPLCGSRRIVRWSRPCTCTHVHVTCTCYMYMCVCGRQAFQAVDLDRSSTVNRKELEQALGLMDIKLSSEDSA